MSLLQAILMGIIQGVTEFLPVSSSGHLAIFKVLFQIEEPGLLFDVLLHVGTLFAVFIVYFKDIIKMIAEFFCMIGDCFHNMICFFKNRFGKEKESYLRIVSNSYRKFDLLVIIATIPTGIIGIVDSDFVEMASELLIVPGICLILTGVLLLIADHTKEGDKTPQLVTYSNAFIIGICQGIATLPGLSRSGTTITACLVSGFKRQLAVKFSFILSIPAILGSLVFEIKDIDVSLITSTELLNYVVGMIVAGVVGYICIKTMLLVVRKKKFLGFAIYCFIIGAISVGTYFYMA